jgi:hypothetical protein
MRVAARFWVLGLGCGALVACATAPPTEQIARAESAVARAQQQQAMVSAPLPLRQSQEKLERAKDAVRDDEYVDARRLAEEAIVDANLASATAERAKTEQGVKELAHTVDMLQREVQP